MGESSAGTYGISTTSLLGVAFVVLKLCGVINWPWVWVCCPFWAPFVILILILLVGAWLITTAWVVHKLKGKFK